MFVGTGTLLADDPALTARAETGGLLVPAERRPVPVVLGRRPIPSGARILEHPALAARGLAEPIRLTGDDLAADLAELHERGIRRLFVEGGPAVASSLIAAGLVDEVLIYLAPALLGGPRLRRHRRRRHVRHPAPAHPPPGAVGRRPAREGRARTGGRAASTRRARRIRHSDHPHHRREGALMLLIEEVGEIVAVEPWAIRCGSPCAARS